MASKLHAMARFITSLERLAANADKLGLTLGNGSEVGSLLGSMADDLREHLFDGTQPQVKPSSQ